MTAPLPTSIRAQKQVLIVDDVEDNRILLDRALRSGNYGTLHADSGRAALSIISARCPDIVLLDISLPGIDGLETSRRLTTQRPAPLVVLISADDDPVLRDSAREYGAAGFVSKQELRPGILRALWDRHGGAAAAITPPG